MNIDKRPFLPKKPLKCYVTQTVGLQSSRYLMLHDLLREGGQPKMLRNKVPRRGGKTGVEELL